MGTPEFAKVILESLYETGFPILAVFAQPDKPVGRGHKMASPPVAEFAKEKNLTLYQPDPLKNSPEEKTLTELNPDFIIVAAYGKILSAKVLQSAKIDVVNVHASLLPKYRGAAPIHYAILNGEKKTGVSIMSVCQELDAGAVYQMAEEEIIDEDTSPDLLNRLAVLGGKALVDALPKIFSGELKAKEQNHADATYSPKLTKELSVIDWSKSAEEIHNQVRALVPWPVAITTLTDKRCKIFKTRVLKTQSKGDPGQMVHVAKAGVTVVTGSGDLLIEEMQLDGKKRMKSFDLINGLRLEVGERFI